MFTEAYLEPSQTSATELLSLRSNHILKTHSIQLNCLLASIFYTTQHFLQKLTTVKISGEKVFC